MLCPRTAISHTAQRKATARHERHTPRTGSTRPPSALHVRQRMATTSSSLPWPPRFDAATTEGAAGAPPVVGPEDRGPLAVESRFSTSARVSRAPQR